jgi:hypothetical protein
MLILQSTNSTEQIDPRDIEKVTAHSDYWQSLRKIKYTDDTNQTGEFTLRDWVGMHCSFAIRLRSGRKLNIYFTEWPADPESGRQNLYQSVQMLGKVPEYMDDNRYMVAFPKDRIINSKEEAAEQANFSKELILKLINSLLVGDIEKLFFMAHGHLARPNQKLDLPSEELKAQRELAIYGRASDSAK